MRPLVNPMTRIRPLPGDALGRAVIGVTADRVVVDVRAPSVGDVLHPVGEVLAPVVDGVISTEGTAQLDLGRTARSGDDRGPQCLAQLDGCAAHAAGAGMDERRPGCRAARLVRADQPVW